jgi:site-specific recombinase XerD
MVENVRFSVEISRLCGIHIRQICTSENCIPHVNEREIARERPGLTHEDVDAFFDAIDEELMMCARFRSKSLRPLQRDKTMFDLTYSCGLRASELIGLDVTSFVPNPQCPALGDFGFVSVWGKGSSGSGPRHRLVPNIDANLPVLLDWYREYVRPQFMMRADPNEKALFLSERGRRLSLSALEERFHHILRLAGLEGKGYTPHSLRHSSVSHKNWHLSLESLRILHGHKFAATTQGYMHIPDEDVDREMTKAIRASIRFAEEHKHD